MISRQLYRPNGKSRVYLYAYAGRGAPRRARAASLEATRAASLEATERARVARACGVRTHGTAIYSNDNCCHANGSRA